jgi:hypothetical protein
LQRKLLRIINEGFDATGELPIIYSAFMSLKNKREYNEVKHQLFTDFKKGYDSISRDVLYNKD